MKDKEIANYTAIKLKALPRCNMQFTCNQCLDLAEEYEDGQQVKVSKIVVFVKDLLKFVF